MRLIRALNLPPSKGQIIEPCIEQSNGKEKFPHNQAACQQDIEVAEL